MPPSSNSVTTPRGRTLRAQARAQGQAQAQAQAQAQELRARAQEQQASLEPLAAKKALAPAELAETAPARVQRATFQARAQQQGRARAQERILERQDNRLDMPPVALERHSW